MNIGAIRTEYKQRQLSEADVAATPHQQFEIWWQEVINSNIEEPNAMTLSTVSADGQPSSRIVLLKGFDSNGLVFFTNYKSRKGREIAANNRVSLLFFWKELERQIRIDGIAEKIDAGQSDSYFLSRPTGSQIGAWASPQSEPVENREALDRLVNDMEQKFTDETLTRPDHWGGYIVKPARIEFWQGRPNRLHDRIEYSGNRNEWKVQRLAP